MICLSWSAPSSHALLKTRDLAEPYVPRITPLARLRPEYPYEEAERTSSEDAVMGSFKRGMLMGKISRSTGGRAGSAIPLWPPYKCRSTILAQEGGIVLLPRCRDRQSDSVLSRRDAMDWLPKPLAGGRAGRSCRILPCRRRQEINLDGSDSWFWFAADGVIDFDRCQTRQGTRPQIPHACSIAPRPTRS